MAAAADSTSVSIRAFPQIANRQHIPPKLANLYGRLTNNEFFFKVANRDFIRTLAKFQTPALGEAAQRVASEMRMHGFAVAHFSEFFEQSMFDALREFFDARHADLQAARDKSKKPLKGKEVYLDTVHKAHTFAANDPVSDFLAAPVFAAISAAYMNMTPRFVGSSFWHTRQMPSSSRGYSQLWHRDYNDRRLLKAFLYLSDVGPKNGYFEYLTGSAATLPLGRMFDRIGPDGLRAYPEREPVDAFMQQFPVVQVADVPPDQRSGANAPWATKPCVVRCCGGAGSLIFADTFGIHRGGFVEEGHRDMVMLTYSTNFNVHKPHFQVTPSFADSLSPFMKMAFGVA